jgi:hypothetical protein
LLLVHEEAISYQPSAISLQLLQAASHFEPAERAWQSQTHGLETASASFGYAQDASQ